MRTGTAASAASHNRILLLGEEGYTTDTHVFKVGDGVTHWNDLAAVSGGTALTQEQVEDYVGAMVSGNTETGITVAYNDGTGKLDFTATAYTDEQARDALAAALVAGANVTITPNDGADTITIAATSAPPTAAQVYAITDPARVVPSSPNVKDDEFDGTSSVTWSNTPTAPATASHNGTAPGSLYLAATTTGATFVGRVQPVPASYPFTITTRMTMGTSQGNYQSAGIIIGPTSPTGSSGLVLFGTRATNQASRWTGTFAGSFASETNSNLGPNSLPLLFRAVFASASSVDLEWSKDGLVWMPHQAGLNPGFTPGVIGLAVNDEGSSTRGCKAVFDFFRVT